MWTFYLLEHTDMSFTRILFLFVVIGLSACSSNANYHKPGCRSADPICLGLSIAQAANAHESSKKCSDMTGDKRKKCSKQVDLLKKHIDDASNK